MWFPAIDVTGIVKAALKVPVGPAVIDAGIVACLIPSYVITIVELGVKPVPVTVTSVPGGPDNGLIDNDVGCT